MSADRLGCPMIPVEGQTGFRPIIDRMPKYEPKTPEQSKRLREQWSAKPGEASSSGLRPVDREAPDAAIVPASARRVHRRANPVLDVAVPAVGFGFDEIPAVDEAIVPILWDAGLVSALALSVPSYTRGGAAPTGSLDVLMAEFSGGSCIGRDARRSKHFFQLSFAFVW